MASVEWRFLCAVSRNALVERRLRPETIHRLDENLLYILVASPCYLVSWHFRSFSFLPFLKSTRGRRAQACYAFMGDAEDVFLALIMLREMCNGQTRPGGMCRECLIRNQRATMIAKSSPLRPFSSSSRFRHVPLRLNGVLVHPWRAPAMGKRGRQHSKGSGQEPNVKGAFRCDSPLTWGGPTFFCFSVDFVCEASQRSKTYC